MKPGPLTASKLHRNSQHTTAPWLRCQGRENNPISLHAEPVSRNVSEAAACAGYENNIAIASAMLSVLYFALRDCPSVPFVL
jgi:hypothetical protein